jgi:hypothetical protein
VHALARQCIYGNTFYTPIPGCAASRVRDIIVVQYEMCGYIDIDMGTQFLSFVFVYMALQTAK